MKLDKLYFGLYKDLYPCVQYIAPRHSPSYIILDDGHDRHDKFSNEIDNFSTMGDVAIIGDLNSGVGTHQEVHFNVNTDSNNADITKPVLVIPRNSYDLQVNAHKRKLLQIMTNHGMLFANGRICGDMAGNLTCCQYNCSSVVDVLIAQRDLIPLINYFAVLPFDRYSVQIAKRTFKKYKDEFAQDTGNLDRRDRYLRDKRFYKKIIYKV